MALGVSQECIHFGGKKSVFLGKIQHINFKIYPHTTIDAKYGEVCMSNKVSVHGYFLRYRSNKYYKKGQKVLVGILCCYYGGYKLKYTLKHLLTKNMGHLD